MSAFWAVFLLCSLLTPSRGLGIMSSVAKVHVDDSLAKRDLQKLPGGLLGGGLLNGAVGSLLGGDGAVGSLLGGDGAVGSLLGGDGAVGSLLGGDGAVGSLLGGDGAVGSLLGGDGAVGSLLSKDGAVRSLLSKDGAVGSLIGGDGAVGSLLDRDGVLGGLLGKDGLVDGLLDAVLDILIGKDGLLGKDGLVGNLLGGNGGDLTGMKIVNNTLPKISLHPLPGFGHQVGFNTQLLIETTSAPGKALCVQVEADVVMLVQDKWVAPQKNKDCKTLDINIRVRPKVPLLDQPLKRLLSDVLREAGCDIVNSRLNVVSTLLGSRTPALPLGALGDLPPFSIISGDAIQLDLNGAQCDRSPPSPTNIPALLCPLQLLVGDTEGSVGASAQGLPLAATLLLATGHPPRLSLSQRTLGVLLKSVQGQGAFNLSITNSMVPDSVSLSTAALFPLVPQLAKILPSSLPLELRVQVANEPVVAVRGRRATATLKASIDIFSPPLQSSHKPLFSLDTDIVLNIIPSVSDGKLQTSLALDSINLTQAPLRLNPLSVSPLAGWLKQVLAATYVPAINDALHVSVPLPEVLNTSLRNTKVDVTAKRSLKRRLYL
ncbi:BPI fold-containing family B member 3-like [Gavia stellata]|uniref:BPI fold-containing family B member 3-like n=1 Tax=Gavia stellata TaxID=37040 RepID=UPI002897AED3|nr:BPI fold-containing family B member 3-like [Gavia stellata]